MPNEMRYYPLDTGQWGLFVDGTELKLDTLMEVRQAMSKITFAEEIQETATALARAGEAADRIHRTYFDRTYNSGGANELADADVSALGMTAAQVTAFITLAEQLANFRNNAAVTQADYDATLNTLRTDV